MCVCICCMLFTAVRFEGSIFSNSSLEIGATFIDRSSYCLAISESSVLKVDGVTSKIRFRFFSQPPTNKDHKDCLALLNWVEKYRCHLAKKVES